MSTILRMELLLLALIFLFVAFQAVSKKKMQLKYSLLWLLVALCMVIAACFPDLIQWLTKLAGIETPSNFIYLLGIVVLLILSFSLSMIVSRQSDQIKRLAQYTAIEAYLNRQKNTPAKLDTKAEQDCTEPLE